MTKCEILKDCIIELRIEDKVSFHIFLYKILYEIYDMYHTALITKDVFCYAAFYSFSCAYMGFGN